MLIVEPALAAIELLFSWPVILFVVIGTLVGLLFGALPGLGGVVVLALLIPITIALDARTAMALFGAALGGVAFGGSISAILINVPGTVGNTATLLDGYPMTQKGESGKAIGASAAGSALGAVFGLLVLIALIPVAQEIILAFAAPEFFVLTVFGLTIIAFVVRGDFYKGIASGGLGVMFSFFGFSPFTTDVRYNLVEIVGLPFGGSYLYDGINIVVATIGLFAIAEALNLIARPNDTIADIEQYRKSGGVLEGMKEVLRRPALFFQSATIGTLVGMIPGVGGSVANFMAYIRVKQKDPENLGTGDVRGLIATETANDAKDGGALIPALAFGIPGSATTALILSALTLHGIVPGPDLLVEELDVVFVLIFALLLSNILTSLIGISVANQISKVTVIPTTYLVPFVMAISVTGAFVLRGHFGDVLVTLLFGVVGFFMILYSYSRIAMLIGLLLGRTAEVTFTQAIRAYDAGVFVFFIRPISLLLLVVLALMIARSLLKNRRSDAPAT